MNNRYIVAIVGNPNCGKTTLFNGLTGAQQQVGNWPGVTVEKRSGFYQHNGQSIEVVDLPGTYSLDSINTQQSIDERVACDYILSKQADLVINILDASNLERNLYLTSQLSDMGVPVVVVLNMMDVAAKNGVDIDLDALSRMLGCPVYPLTAHKQKEVSAFQGVIHQYLQSPPAELPARPLGGQLEFMIDAVTDALFKYHAATSSPRWQALQLLDPDIDGGAAPDEVRVVIAEQLAQLSDDEEFDILLASRRYDSIGTVMAEVICVAGSVSHQLTESIDRVVLNRMFGLPIFLAVMYCMFMFTINFGSSFIDFFDITAGTIFVEGAGHLLNSINAPDWLTMIVAQGIGGGIQTVATFIPVIGCLFLFLSVLEDSGYMARAAFVIDRLMRFLGLPGKAFVPMLVGFGCNVPAIMAARTLDNEKDRLLTISMAPFMSCGARLPVYVLFAAAFFPATGQNVVFTLYLVGVFAAIFTGLVLKGSLLPGKSAPFVMELPNYHLPSPKQVLLRTWDRLKSFIGGAGKIIVSVVLVLNLLNSIGSDGSFGHEDTQSSMLSKIGQTITPVFAPMGMSEDNWPAAVGIFTGILAKEAVVGTLDAMYSSIAAVQVEESEEEDTSFDLWGGLYAAWQTIPANLLGLTESLDDPLGIKVGELSNTSAVAEEQGVDMGTFVVMRQLFPSDAAVVAYLLLILLYTPCVAVLGAIAREVNLRWTIFVAAWTFLLGYAVATIYYQASLFTVSPVSASLWCTGMIAMLVVVVLYMRRIGMNTIEAIKSLISVTQ